MLNAVLFLVVSGQSWSIPGFDLDISSIPAVQEVLLFTSALSFFFLCSTFVTNQCYIAIIYQFGNRIVDSNLIDPDFFNASRKHYDFFLKVFTPKLNIWGADFYQSGKGFAVFSSLIKFIVVLVALTLPAAHLALSWAASVNVYSSDLNILGVYFLIGSVWLINFGGFLIVFGLSKEFNFKIIDANKNYTAENASNSDEPNSSD